MRVGHGIFGNMSITTAIFDFDGTIADTFELIVNLYNRVAPELDCRPLEPEDLERLRGSQIHPKLFAQYGVPLRKVPQLLLRIRGELKEHIAYVQPIAGMIEAIVACKQADLRLGIMTSNDREIVASFLRTHEIDRYFDFIYPGKNLFGKGPVLKRLMAEQGVVAKQAVYVGDETRDIRAAKKVGLRMIAVGWGFNSPQALRAAHPDVIVDQPAHLLSAIQSFS